MSNIVETSRIRVAFEAPLNALISIVPQEGFICLNLLQWARSCAEAMKVCVRECSYTRDPSEEFSSIELDRRVSITSAESLRLLQGAP